VPFVAYVHAREPEPPEDRRPVWEPNWRVWRWVALAVAAGFASAHTHAMLSAVFTLVAFVSVCQAAAEALPNGDGLREYRQ
jgi:hypothetical protein